MRNFQTGATVVSLPKGRVVAAREPHATLEIEAAPRIHCQVIQDLQRSAGLRVWNRHNDSRAAVTRPALCRSILLTRVSQRVALILARGHHACTIGRLDFSEEQSVAIMRYGPIILKSAVRGLQLRRATGEARRRSPWPAVIVCSPHASLFSTSAPRHPEGSRGPPAPALPLALCFIRLYVFSGIRMGPEELRW